MMTTQTLYYLIHLIYFHWFQAGQHLGDRVASNLQVTKRAAEDEGHWGVDPEVFLGNCLPIHHVIQHRLHVNRPSCLSRLLSVLTVVVEQLVSRLHVNRPSFLPAACGD